MSQEEESKFTSELVESVKKLLENREKENSKSFATVSLLVFGTILTILSSLTVSYFNNKNNDEIEVRKFKLSVIEKLGQDAELRSILCNDLMNAQNSNDDTTNHDKGRLKRLDTARTRYVSARLHFDATAVAYQAQLLKYFGKEDKDYFRLKIYNDLVDLGDIAELGKGGQSGRNKFGAIRNNLEDKIQDFCNRLYVEVH